MRLKTTQQMDRTENYKAFGHLKLLMLAYSFPRDWTRVGDRENRIFTNLEFFSGCPKGQGPEGKGNRVPYIFNVTLVMALLMTLWAVDHRDLMVAAQVTGSPSGLGRALASLEQGTKARVPKYRSSPGSQLEASGMGEEGETSAGSCVGRKSNLYLQQSADIFQSTDLALRYRIAGKD